MQTKKRKCFIIIMKKVGTEVKTTFAFKLNIIAEWNKTMYENVIISNGNKIDK